MNFGAALKGFSNGMQGSPMSRMNGQQKLQALGAAFGGDQDQLAQIMGSLEPAPGRPQRQAPVMNEDGEDISAAFGGGGGGGGGMSGREFGLLGPLLMNGGGMGLLGGLLGGGFGFGKKKDR